MQSTRRGSLMSAQLAALLAIAGAPVFASDGRSLERTSAPRPSPQPLLPQDTATPHRREHAPGWHDPQRVAAAVVKRARKGQHRLRCAARGALGPDWRVSGA